MSKNKFGTEFRILRSLLTEYRISNTEFRIPNFEYRMSINWQVKKASMNPSENYLLKIL